MPELPEVETVRRILNSSILNDTFQNVEVLSPKQLDASARDLTSRLPGATIVGTDRRGKFLILRLAGERSLVFHLRMEGKLFVLAPQEPLTAHPRFIFHLASGRRLVFDDTRRFGKVWLYDSLATPCTDDLGPEANRLDPQYVARLLERENRPLKEVLLDQTKIAGIGNIYANEICFACRLSPFIPADKIIDIPRAAADIANQSRRILDLSITKNGSTVKTYRASAHVSGDFQNFLQVYGREGEKCHLCQAIIMKRALAGRGTSFCPNCQHVPLVIGVTGGIATGKSTICHFLEKDGFQYLNMDRMAKEAYDNPGLRTDLKAIDPQVFDSEKGLNKDYLRKRLTDDQRFRRRWLTRLYSFLRDEVNETLNHLYNTPVVIEAPLLFQAKLDSFCRLKILAETDQQLAHLKARGDKDPERSLRFGATNDPQSYRDRCDFRIDTSGPLSELEGKVNKVLDSLKSLSGGLDHD